MVEQLQKIISVTIAENRGDVFPAAWAAALEAVREQEIDAQLISWKNNLTGEASPSVQSCRCDIEGWELYALTRGATLRVEVNGGKLIFLFRPLEADLTV